MLEIPLLLIVKNIIFGAPLNSSLISELILSFSRDNRSRLPNPLKAPVWTDGRWL